MRGKEAGGAAERVLELALNGLLAFYTREIVVTFIAGNQEVGSRPEGEHTTKCKSLRKDKSYLPFMRKQRCSIEQKCEVRIMAEGWE